jgi:hypothetical protein
LYCRAAAVDSINVRFLVLQSKIVIASNLEMEKKIEIMDTTLVMVNKPQESLFSAVEKLTIAIVTGRIKC